MKCSEIMEVCRKLAPEDCACDWDIPVFWRAGAIRM